MNLKKHWKMILAILLFSLILVPLLLLIGEHFLNGGWFSEADNGDWLGFWGGYLGAFITIPSAYYVASYSAKTEARNSILEKQNDRLNELALPMMKYQTQIRQFVRYDFRQIIVQPKSLEIFLNDLSLILKQYNVEYTEEINLALISLNSDNRIYFESDGKNIIEYIDKTISKMSYNYSIGSKSIDGNDQWIKYFDGVAATLKKVATSLDELSDIALNMKKDI